MGGAVAEVCMAGRLCQEEVAADLDATVRKARSAAAREADKKRSGTHLAHGE
ncbi:hypothetical protein GCM10018777_18780 [Streptomyces albogriseolus]|nr:hypothetical protein GCM10018777_18780 [Streptomyces viridodiastaticus]